MEIELKKHNDYVATEYSYKITAYTEKQKKIGMEVKYNELDFMVLQLLDVPNAKQIKVDILLKVVEKEEIKNYQESIFLNPKLAKITAISTQEKSADEYKMASLENEVYLINLQIESKREEITALDNLIKAYQESIQELEESVVYQTQTEQQITQNKIENHLKTISNSEQEKKAIESEIEIHEAETAKISEKIEEIKAQQGV